MNRPFTADDVRDILSNPAYVGLGPFQPIVAQEAWLDANVNAIRQDGPADAIRRILARFHESFPTIPPLDPAPYVLQAGHDPRSALCQLLADLRRATETPHRHPGDA